METAATGGFFATLGISSDLIFFVALLAMAPFVIISATSFVKLAVVFSLIRNALGVQQIPPNMVIYGLAITITIYIMLPVGAETFRIVSEHEAQGQAIEQYLPQALAPLTKFMARNADEGHIAFFADQTEKIWPDDLGLDEELHIFLTLLPAFLITELSEAFEIGFLIYLPFIAIDIVVSNILLSLGMMMVSPVTIALPFKLFLFVAIDGWTRLVRGLIEAYGTG